MFAVSALLSAAPQQKPAIPPGPMVFGGFAGEFRADGTFSIAGAGWPTFVGTWKADGARVELALTKPMNGCDGAGRYDVSVSGAHVSFTLVEDACQSRRMILGGSTWRPANEPAAVANRRFALTTAKPMPALPAAASSAGSWPSFRGRDALGIAENQKLPDSWNGTTGDHILWRTPVPGLGHSSPIVWGDRVFVTSAISEDPKAGFKPGLYGDGDASTDRSRHRFAIYALDRRSGKMLWERVAVTSAPDNKRHIKNTYASASPVTDGRTVVAWFGSQGLHAYDVNGNFRWRHEFGRVDMGAYDIPTYEWGPASSPIIWNGLVIVQCDTQADSFVMALDVESGKVVWKTERDELPSWGTPTVVTTSRGPELVTNASNFVRGYDPKTGKERWRLGRSSKITAPTPFAAGDLIVVASGRGPERPVFVVRPGAEGDITPPAGASESAGVVWSKTGRGSYMPTPLALGGLLYVLANNGVFDAYELATGNEVYRQRLDPVGSGFSASPVAADGRIYLSNEDGDMIVVAAGPEFRQIARNPMGELLMATPALSNGVMFVRGVSSVFAIGNK